jgi:hypothetical protein
VELSISLSPDFLKRYAIHIRLDLRHTCDAYHLSRQFCYASKRLHKSLRVNNRGDGFIGNSGISSHYA